MSNKQLKSQAIENPCIGDCRINPDEVCIGCGRNRDEKLDWIFMSDNEKKQVVIKAKERLKLLKLDV